MANKYALILEYDGSIFHGWQIQNDVKTVQGLLEAALSKFANEPIATITAGRTDTGVHALNQVVHFTSSAKRNLDGWVRGVNALLPSEIRIKRAVIVDDNFDARFSALSRTYHYYLRVAPINSAHLSRYQGWYYHELDIIKMQQAAQLLIGRHDFSSFRAAGCQANSPIREMYNLAIEQKGNLIRFNLTANAFLHHMVRNIVGALVYVGVGRITVADFQQVFASANRNNAPPTFMSNGLYLANVQYPDIILGDEDFEQWLFN